MLRYFPLMESVLHDPPMDGGKTSGTRFRFGLLCLKSSIKFQKTGLDALTSENEGQHAFQDRRLSDASPPNARNAAMIP